MKVMFECVFFSRTAPDLLSRITSLIRIFAGAILHDELSFGINILRILTQLWDLNGKKTALRLWHNNAPKVQTMLRPQQRRSSVRRQ